MFYIEKQKLVTIINPNPNPTNPNPNPNPNRIKLEYFIIKNRKIIIY